MEIGTFNLLALFGVTIIVGYVGNLIFEKTKIPSVIWLLLFGLIVGPVLSLVDRALFLSISPFLTALALMLILFEAGLEMDLYQTIRGFPRSIFLAVVSIILSTVATAGISVYLFGFDLLTGLLLGAIVSGTSSPIVLSITKKLRAKENVKTMLNLESIFSDPLVVIISISLLKIIAEASEFSAVREILSQFSIGAVIGLMVGVAWLFVLDKLKGRKFDYMLTLAVLFLLYVFVERYGGSGAISSLMFGLVLGNSVTTSKILKVGKSFHIDKLFKTFQSEVSFFMESFFFVFMGIIFVINRTYFLYGLIIAAVLILIRLVAVEIGTFKMQTGEKSKNYVRTMVSRGLAAAVLAQYPVIFGIPNGEIFLSVVFVIIAVTVVYNTITTKLISDVKVGEE